MKICLIWPKSTFLTDPMVYPGLGLWYVWTALEKRSCEVFFKDTSEDAYESIPNSDYYFVGGTSPQLMEIKKILAWLKENRPGITVLGGAHALTQKKDDLLKLGFDIVYKGEVNNAKDLDIIFNVPKYEKGVFIDQPFSPDLKDIILPSRKAALRYHAFLYDKNEQPYRATTLFTSRGCPQKCAFCESGAGRMWGRKIRWNPLEIVSKEIEECYELGFRGIMFFDDILPLNKTRMLKLLEVLKKFNIVWRCFLRSDMLIRQGGYRYLKAMRDAGLVEVLVGVESGSNQIKENIQKGTTAEQDIEVLNWCKSLGIKFKASFVLGLPGETFETMESTRKFIFTHKPDRVDVATFIPFPGTPLSSDMTSGTGKYDLYLDTSGLNKNGGYKDLPETYWYKGPRDKSVCLVGTSNLTPQQIHDYRDKLIKDIIDAGIPY